jgi:hypothetical protein
VLKAPKLVAAAGVWSCGLGFLLEFLEGVLKGSTVCWWWFFAGSAPEWLEYHQEFYGSSITPKLGTTHSGYFDRQNV